MFYLAYTINPSKELTFACVNVHRLDRSSLELIFKWKKISPVGWTNPRNLALDTDNKKLANLAMAKIREAYWKRGGGYPIDGNRLHGYVFRHVPSLRFHYVCQKAAQHTGTYRTLEELA